LSAKTRSYTCRICRRYNSLNPAFYRIYKLEEFWYFVIVLFGRFVGVRHTPSFIIRGIGIIMSTRIRPGARGFACGLISGFCYSPWS
jgi:hypothetical protein